MRARVSDAPSEGAFEAPLTLTQPAVTILWGALITALVVIAMLPWFAGLLVVGPVLGHASWHAFRAPVVDLGPLADPPGTLPESRR